MSDTKDKEETSDDLLDGLDEHLQDPEEGARKAGEKPADETHVEDDDKSDDVTDNKDDEKDSESDKDDLSIEDKHTYLKGEVGRQANEIGDLKDKIRELTPAPVAPEPQASPLQIKLEKAKKLYGPEIVELIEEVADSRVAPVQQAQGLQAMRDRYPDFDEVRADMDEIFKATPALRTAMDSDIKVLDTVYTAAKAKRSADSASESTQKDEARRKLVSTQKEEAHVEKPSLKADMPKKETADEKDQAFVDHLIALPPNA